MKLVIFASIILTVNSLTVHEQWFSFKEKHKKSYKNKVEEKHRFQIFQNNLKTIEQHNARYEKGEKSYYMGVNKYADLTTEEFSKKLLRSQPEQKKKLPFVDIPKDDIIIPDTYDARTVGGVFPVRDQGECASGYAIASTGAVEGLNFLKNGVSEELSAQEVIDCSFYYNNKGCNGGILYGSYQYIVDNGISSETAYPFAQEEGKCLYNQTKSVYSIWGYGRVPGLEDALKYLISNVSPTSVNIYANSLQLYEGGIYDDEERCVNDWYSLNHHVLAVGYDSENGIEYWILKNSWGTDWGEQGYIRLRRNPSQCGVLLDLTYPIVK